MRRIKVFDTTLRDGEQAPGFSMSLGEKLEMARHLEKLGADIIEAGFAATSPDDEKAVSGVSDIVRDCVVTSLCRAVAGDIDTAWNALKKAAAPRIHIVLATSKLHMERKLRKTPAEILEMTAASVAYAKKLCPDVQFSAEDACRSDIDFLCEVIAAAINAGANVINIPDTVGYIFPAEFEALIREIIRRTDSPGTEFSVHCHNDLGLAAANTLAGVLGGASQIECTVGGIGERAGNAALEEVVMAMNTRPLLFNAVTNIDTREIYPAFRRLQRTVNAPFAPNKPIVGKNAFAHEAGIHQHGVAADRATYEILKPEDIGVPASGIVLGKHSGRHAFDERVKALGYELSEECREETFRRFKKLAEMKRSVTDYELEALIPPDTEKNPAGHYKLEDFVINSGTQIDATCRINLIGTDANGIEERFAHVALGSGPIEAAFTAINTIVGYNFALDDFSLESVSEGEDALGESKVRLSCRGKTSSGKGASADIVEAGIRAYLNAVNALLPKL